MSGESRATPVELPVTLKDLADGKSKKFTWFLEQADVLEGFPAVAKNQSENAHRLDTVDEIMDTYEDAVEKIVKKNDLVL